MLLINVKLARYLLHFTIEKDIYKDKKKNLFNGKMDQLKIIIKLHEEILLDAKLI